ncbi:MAG: hypothetical protein ACF8XB_17425 [Planctomycetota bacterium JB042]
MTRDRGWSRRGTIGGIVVGGVVFLGVLWWGAESALDKFNEVKGPPLPPPAPFDRDFWLENRSEPRVAMALGLVAQKRLLGLDAKAVVALLGPADDDSMDFGWTYVLVDGRRGGMPSPELRIDFLDGVVIGFRYDDVPGFASPQDRECGRRSWEEQDE